MRLAIGLLIGTVALLIPLAAVAQVKNENLANSIIAARQKNAALLRQFNWNCRTEILQEEKVQDIRIEQVTFGADGATPANADQRPALEGSRRIPPKGHRREQAQTTRATHPRTEQPRRSIHVAHGG